MKDATPKEQILSKIRNALLEKTDNPYQDNEVILDVVKASSSDEEAEVLFAQELLTLGGQFIYCESENHFLNNLTGLIQERLWDAVWCQSPKLSQLLSTAQIPHFHTFNETPEPLIGITTCEKLISRTGSIVLSDTEAGSRAIYSFSDIHLVVGYSTQVTSTLRAAFSAIRKKYNGDLPSQITTVTGPSRTADIEKTLVKGAHGPKELFVFLIDDL